MIRPHIQTALWAAVGILIGAAYFTWMMRIDPFLRVTGDALGYLLVAEESSGLIETFFSPAARSAGYPLILELLQMAIEPFVPPGGEPWYEFAPYFFFAFHSGVTIFLFLAVQRALAGHPSRPSVHPVWLMLLLIHPALIAHSTLLLSDIWSSDMVLLGIAILLFYKDGKGLYSSFFAGLCWFWAIYSRTSLLVGAVAALIALVIADWTKARASGRRPWPSVRTWAVAASFLLFTLLGGLPCTLRYGVPCLTQPSFSSTVVSGSLTAGLTNVRTYWSSASNKPRFGEFIEDPWLAEHLRESCNIDLARPDGKAALDCLISRPWIWPVFFAKKTMALMDQPHFHTYIPHLTSPSARRLLRMFSVLGWLGVCAWIALLLFRAPQVPELAALSMFPLFILGTHSLLHVESRYVFAVLPGAFIALGILHGSLAANPPPARRRALGGAAALALAAALMLWQLDAWDSLDLTQARSDEALLRTLQP